MIDFHTNNNNNDLPVCCLVLLFLMICLLAYFIYMLDTDKVAAQNRTSYGMSSYENAVSIKYPSDWIKMTGISKDNLVAFFAPPLETSPAVVAVFKQELLLLPNSVNEESLFNIFSLGQINYINNHYNITSIDKANLSGSAAYQVVFKINNKTVSYTWTLKNYAAYGIMFVANNHSYERYLPQLDKIKEFFKIVDRPRIPDRALPPSNERYSSFPLWP
jgi:hypothetical protein